MSSFDGDVWSCQLCDGIYVSLSKLVGHARGSHQYLNVKCGVNGCDELMSSAVSWYKHVRLHHRAEYYDSVVPETSAESRRHETTGDFDGDNDEMELAVITASDTETADMDSEADSTYNMLTASFLNLKDKHKLSQAAFDDVIKLAEHTCEHMKMKIMEDMKLLAEEQAFDVNSCFYQSLEDQIANMESPVHNVGSAYQQKKYFSANLPYIVSIDVLTLHTVITDPINSIMLYILYYACMSHACTYRNQFGIQLVHILLQYITLVHHPTFLMGFTTFLCLIA